jgi:hypothetical protein
MNMNPVSSSNVDSIGYDAVAKTMAVKFHEGGTYHYHDVSPTTYEALKGAKSIGAYLHRHVKPRYRATRV